MAGMAMTLMKSIWSFDVREAVSKHTRHLYRVRVAAQCLQTSALLTMAALAKSIV